VPYINSHLSLSTGERISNVGHAAAANQLPAFNSAARRLKILVFLLLAFVTKSSFLKKWPNAAMV